MELHEKHRKCTKFHKKLMQNFERNLEKNRQEQELLRRKLQELEAHEKELEEKKELEREAQENAIKVGTRAIFVRAKTRDNSAQIVCREGRDKRQARKHKDSRGKEPSRSIFEYNGKDSR